MEDVMGFSKVDGALANALADEAEQRIGARIPKDTTAMLAKLNESIAADARDAARMREVDALVSGPFVSFVERVAEGLADEHARRHPNFNTWREMGEKDRQIWVWMVRESTTAFAAALLTGGAVEAFDNGYDNAFAPELDRFRAGIRAAIRAAGVEPVERTQSCPRCDMHAAEAKQLGETLDDVEEALRGQGVNCDGDADLHATRIRNLGNALRDCGAKETERADTEKARAEKAESDLAALETVIAETSHAAGISGTMTPAARVRAMGEAIRMSRAEADARSAEVAALRGMATGPGLQAANDRLVLEYGARAPLLIDVAHAITHALATVTPANVADAVKPATCADGHRYRNGMSDSDETCCYMCGFEPPKTTKAEAPQPERYVPFPIERTERATQHHELCNCDACLAEEAPGLEPLPNATAAEAIERGVSALAKWGRHNSAHEGFAVLLEEVDELKAHVWTKQKNRDLAAMRSEAIDVAAVALRFADELCTEERGRR